MQETLTNLKKVFKYGKNFKINLIIQVICSIFRVIIGVILPLFAAKQIVYFTDNIWKQAIYISIVICVINILQNLNTVIFRKNTQIFRRGTVKNIQIHLGNEILKLKQEELDKNSSGKYIQRIVNDTDNMSSIFTSGMSNLTAVVSSIGVFIAVFFINKKVFLYYFITSVILVFLQMVKMKKYGQKDKEYRAELENVAGLTGELVRGAKDIKVLNSKKSFISILKNNIEKQIVKNFEMRNVEISYNFIIDSLNSIFELLLIIVLITLTANKEIDIAIAIALFSYRTNIFSNFMEKISKLLTELSNFNISSYRVFDILESNKSRKEEFGNLHLDNVQGNFKFENVYFGYEKENEILNDLTFSIKSGETVAIVGKSGAGKTTIFNIICKLYNIKYGNVYIDNININDLDEKSIRSNISIINQEPYIFNLSIKDNFKIVKSDITDEQIKEVCKLACIDEFIETLPNRYDTIVGENGVLLSGGQKQRIAIARALIQKSPIILFDEATSALDNETQKNIQIAIENLKEKSTILIIAHRLSTIINCDRILILDDGKIVDSGKHTELIERNLFYRNLCETELMKKG